MACRTKVSRVLNSSLIEKTGFLRTGTSVNGFSGRILDDPCRRIGHFRCYSSFSAAVASNEPRLGLGGFEVLGLKDYYEYRKSLYGEITHKALLVDAVGTLLVPSQPMAEVCIFLFCFFTDVIGFSWGIYFSIFTSLSLSLAHVFGSWERIKGKSFWRCYALQILLSFLFILS